MSLGCPYRPSACSDSGSSTSDVYMRWNKLGIPSLRFWFENLGSHSWTLAFHWWIWAYASRHDRWMGDDEPPIRAQGISLCAIVQSRDWGVPNLNSPRLLKFKARQKVDRMDRQRVVERTRAKRGGRKHAEVRYVLSSAEVLEGVQMNWKVGWVYEARCFTQVFILLVSQDMILLQRV